MQALIFATNETEKLRPISKTIPSALIPLANKPLMEYIVEGLSDQGIDEIIVSLHNLGGSIESYFGTGRRWGVKLNYVLQKDPYGNLGAISRARSLIHEDLIFIPGDSLININFESVIEAHYVSNCELTILTREPIISPTDTVLKDVTGAFIVNQSLIHEITSNGFTDLERDLVTHMQSEGRPINYEKSVSYKEPLSSFQTYNKIQNRFLDHQSRHQDRKNLDNGNPELASSKIRGTFLGKGVWIGKNNMIDPSVRFSPPVVIGDNCQVGREVELGPNVVIGNNVIVDDEATIRKSTILDYTYIGHLVNVDNRFISQNLVIDNESAMHVQITDPFIIAEAAPRVLNRSLRKVIDTTISLLLLVLLSPLFLLIGLLTLLTTGNLFSKEEVFGVTYRQLHKGSKGTPEYFKLLNFQRHNRRGKETRFGRLLYRLELYRLPELINVISGDLSLVGVKPIRKLDLETLTEEWQYQKFNYSCGFTGLWYVQDLSIINSESSIIFDIYYVAMRNFNEDMRIFMKTPLTWWSKLTQNS